MVFYYVLIVSLLVSFCQLFSGATNSTTTLSTTASLTTISPTTTTEAATSQPTATAITPTTTGAATSQSITASTSQPSATVTPTQATAPFNTQMTVTFETENSSECNQGTKEKFKNKTRDLYDDDGFNRENVVVSYSKQTGKCIFNITVIFGQKLSREDVIETFENATKKSNFNGVEIKELNIDVHVDGVTLGEFTPTNCKKICCEGAGGEITLIRKCTSNPANKCANYKRTKVEKNCMNVCEKHCLGAINNISLMAMLLGATMHWLLK